MTIKTYFSTHSTTLLLVNTFGTTWLKTKQVVWISPVLLIYCSKRSIPNGVKPVNKRPSKLPLFIEYEAISFK